MRLRTALLALLLLAQSPAWAVEFGISPPAELRSQRQSYFERPDILQVKARNHLLFRQWRKWRQSHLEAAAAFLELYPTEHLYFLARDTELIYDAARLISRDDPQTLSRLHLLNVSRNNMGNHHLLDYLAQEGISAERLRTDPNFQPVFIDTGFNGTIPKFISERMPDDLRGRIKAHLLLSNYNSTPSLRSFLVSVDPEVNRRRPESMRESMEDYEGIPRATHRSNAYELIDHEWHPTSPIRIRLRERDGEVNPRAARRYQEDLKSFLESSAGRALVQERRQFWRSLRQNWTTLSTEEWTQALKNILQGRRMSWRELRQNWRTLSRDSLGNILTALSPTDQNESLRLEAAVRDFLEWARLIGSANHPQAPVIGPAFVGLPPAEGDSFPQLFQIIRQHPQWASILENPNVQIPALLDSEQPGTLGEILDLAENGEFIQIAIREIAARIHTMPIYALAESWAEIIETREWMISLFSQFQTARYPELLRRAIDNATPGQMERFATEVFSQAHWSTHPELLRLALEKATTEQMWIFGISAFSQPHWSKHPQIQAFRSSLRIQDPEQRRAYLREQFGPYSWEADAPEVCEQQMLNEA